MGFLKKAKRLFTPSTKYEQVEISKPRRIKGEGIRVPLKGFPLRIILGPDETELHLYPERPIGSVTGGVFPDFILFNPKQFYNQISGFIRLMRGKKQILGRYDPEQTDIFAYSEGINNRHLMVEHLGDALNIKDFHSNTGTIISPITDPDQIERVTCRRYEKLYQLRKLYGGPIEPLALIEAQSVLETVNKLMTRETRRPTNIKGGPGAVVRLPDPITPIVMGDLHAQVDNLLNILSENHFLESLENGTACLIILGDAVHSEIDGQMEEMAGSMLMMDLIFKLKIGFPNRVFHIRGNHDSFAPEVSKGGIPQGLLWEKYITDHRGIRYSQEMARYYNQLPYVVLSKDFVACHASPPFRNVNLDILINMGSHQGIARHLINNRIRRSRYPGGYTRTDVKRFRKGLGLGKDFPFIVGHNPLTEKETLWLNAGNIENHHIVYSAKPHAIGVFTRIGNRITPLLYKSEPLLERINAFSDTEKSHIL